MDRMEGRPAAASCTAAPCGSSAAASSAAPSLCWAEERPLTAPASTSRPSSKPSFAASLDLGLRTGSLLHRYRAAARLSYFTHIRPRAHSSRQQQAQEEEKVVDEGHQHLAAAAADGERPQQPLRPQCEQKEQLSLPAAAAATAAAQSPGSAARQRHQRAEAAPPPSPQPPSSPPSIHLNDAQLSRRSSSIPHLRLPSAPSGARGAAAAAAAPTLCELQRTEAATRSGMDTRRKHAHSSHSHGGQALREQRKAAPLSWTRGQSPCAPSSASPTPPPPLPAAAAAAAAAVPLRRPPRRTPSRRRAAEEAMLHEREEREASWTAAFTKEYQQRREERGTLSNTAAAQPSSRTQPTRTNSAIAGGLTLRTSVASAAAPYPPAPSHPPPRPRTPSQSPSVDAACGLLASGVRAPLLPSSALAAASHAASGGGEFRAASVPSPLAGCSAPAPVQPHPAVARHPPSLVAAVVDGEASGAAASAATPLHSGSLTPSSFTSRRGSGHRVRWIDWPVD